MVAIDALLLLRGRNLAWGANQGDHLFNYLTINTLEEIDALSKGERRWDKFDVRIIAGR